jgi:GR25 family glycosyltransferase involved in LPS biosynthesis
MCPYHRKLNGKSIWDIAKEGGVEIANSGTQQSGASCATVGHFLIWKRIMDNQECAVILEHDAVMLHYPDFYVEDNKMVVLGYKVQDPERYDHFTAGGTKQLVPRKKHGGAHAYAINHVTAKTFLDTLSTSKHRVSYIDNQYFFGDQGRGGVEMEIADPICAIGWLRDSTIWNSSAVDNYGPMLESFLENYHSDKDLGIKL